MPTVLPFSLSPGNPLSLEQGAPLQGEPLNEARLGNRAAQLSITAISSIIQS